MKNLLFLLVLLSASVSAQTEITELKSDLNFYADAMINAFEPENRMRAGDKFSELFSEYCETQKEGIIDLSFLKFIMVLTSEDSLFSVATWQVQLDNNEYAYNGYIFQKDRPYVELQSAGSLNQDVAYETHTPDDWYGALYYKMQKFNETDYLIFGYNVLGEFTKSKVADVLRINDSGITFGAEIFQNKEDTLTYDSKIVIEYSADASVNLNFNPGMNMIVHDHLINRMGRLPNQGPTNVPDGTYEGYAFTDGKWMYQEKLFNHSYGNDNAPRPEPLLDNRKNPTRKKGTKKRK